jgi:hypothetical protein
VAGALGVTLIEVRSAAALISPGAPAPPSHGHQLAPRWPASRALALLAAAGRRPAAATGCPVPARRSSCTRVPGAGVALGVHSWCSPELPAAVLVSLSCSPRAQPATSNGYSVGARRCVSRRQQLPYKYSAPCCALVQQPAAAARLASLAHHSLCPPQLQLPSTCAPPATAYQLAAIYFASPDATPCLPRCVT